MLRLTCPYCGTRDETEFTFGGEAHLTRPTLEVDDATWSDYLFNRENPKGMHFERWRHTYGCGQWFNVARDTVSHEIHAVYKMNEAKPELEEENSNGS